jgi:RNA polymerase sigma-70 factor, ECF subfamily
MPMSKSRVNISLHDIWEDFHARLLLFVSRRVKQPADAEDVVQEIFVQIHKNLATVKDEARLPAWVFKIARNAIVDYFRKNARATETLDEDFDAPAPTESSESDYAALSEVAQCLEPTIEALPEAYRQAIRLTELRGLTQQEAAKQIGVSVSGMKSRVQRGRGKLQAMLLSCCEIDLDNRRRIVAYRRRNGGCGCCSSD